MSSTPLDAHDAIRRQRAHGYRAAEHAADVMIDQPIVEQIAQTAVTPAMASALLTAPSAGAARDNRRATSPACASVAATSWRRRRGHGSDFDAANGDVNWRFGVGVLALKGGYFTAIRSFRFEARRCGHWRHSCGGHQLWL